MISALAICFEPLADSSYRLRRVLFVASSASGRTGQTTSAKSEQTNNEVGRILVFIIVFFVGEELSLARPKARTERRGRQPAFAPVIGWAFSVATWLSSPG